MEIGFGAAGFQILDLGGDAAGKEGKGDLVFFDGCQVMGDGFIESLDADHAGTETFDFLFAGRQHVIRQVGREVAQRKKRQPALGQYGGGKIGVVADVGHGALHDGVTGAVFLGQGRPRAHGVVCVDGLQLFADMGEESVQHFLHGRSVAGEMAGEDGVLPQIEQALERGVARRTEIRHMGFDLAIENGIGIFLARQNDFPVPQGLDDARAQFGEKVIAGFKGLTDDGGVLFLQLANDILIDRRQGRFFGQVKLVVQHDAFRPHGKQAGGGMPADAAVDEDRPIAVFKIPLQEDER
jgi:hypothetical protein